MRREYTSGRPTTLAAAFDIGAATFTIADDGSAATWPTSADYDFFVTIDAGTAQEERVLCSGRASRVVTVATSGRGADGTTESNHLSGATVWPSWSATDAAEANIHVESTGYASYSKSVHGLGSGDGVVVGTTSTQTLTNKTLTSPKINENVALTPTSTELNYVDGVTSAIQTQLDAKAPIASPTFTGTVALPALGSGLVPTGTETHTLTEAQMPSHSHTYQFGNGGALDTSGTYITQVSPNLVTVGSSSGAGSGSAHNIMQPSIVVNFIIKT